MHKTSWGATYGSLDFVSRARHPAQHLLRANLLSALLSNHLPNYRNLMSIYFALQAAKKS